MTDYGRSKLFAERAALAKKDEISLVIVRPPAIYGPRDREILALFERVDVLITPSSPVVAPLHDVWVVEVGGQKRNYRLEVGRFSRPWNLCGFPAIVLPSGVTAEGLPTSVQLVAPPFAEGRLLAVAQALEQELAMASRLGIDVRGD